jgi:hypothetical protein
VLCSNHSICNLVFLSAILQLATISYDYFRAFSNKNILALSMLMFLAIFLLALNNYSLFEPSGYLVKSYLQLTVVSLLPCSFNINS